jgi:hypothetical protein
MASRLGGRYSTSDPAKVPGLTTTTRRPESPIEARVSETNSSPAAHEGRREPFWLDHNRVPVSAGQSDVLIAVQEVRRIVALLNVPEPLPVWSVGFVDTADRRFRSYPFESVIEGQLRSREIAIRP